MNRFPIEKMCRASKVGRSGYYGWLTGVPSARTVRNRELTALMGHVHLNSRKTYGGPRITHELREQGIRVSRPHVARLMRAAGIRSCVGKRYRVCTTDSNHGSHVAENLLDRNFSTETPATAWVSDITYIRTVQGWLYLTTVIDPADRMVTGWALSSTMKAKDTSVEAWEMAVVNRSFTTELIFHSDRGVQYACDEFVQLIGAYPKVKQSIACPGHLSGSRKGNCWDNAVAESFFKTLESECTDRQKYQTVKEAEMAVFQYIEGWYDTGRRHSTLNCMTPIQYSQSLKTGKIAA